MPSPLTKNKLPATATKSLATATKSLATATKSLATATKSLATATKLHATATKHTPSSKAPARVKRGGIYDDTYTRYETMMDVEFERIMTSEPHLIEEIKKNNTHEVKTLVGFKYKVNEEEVHKQIHALLHKNVSQKMTKDDLIKINVHNFSGRVSYVFKRRI
jgi:hypothetical protein